MHSNPYGLAVYVRRTKVESAEDYIKEKESEEEFDQIPHEVRLECLEKEVQVSDDGSGYLYSVFPKLMSLSEDVTSRTSSYELQFYQEEHLWRILQKLVSFHACLQEHV